MDRVAKGARIVDGKNVAKSEKVLGKQMVYEKENVFAFKILKCRT